jgi:hypothetical protein
VSDTYFIFYFAQNSVFAELAKMMSGDGDKAVTPSSKTQGGDCAQPGAASSAQINPSQVNPLQAFPPRYIIENRLSPEKSVTSEVT